MGFTDLLRLHLVDARLFVMCYARSATLHKNLFLSLFHQPNLSILSNS